jgi:hypothetical protein|tara:strand:+ start:4227 stop:5312 length:1086 start_codon:yes stop_codon:yes gene_type:complete
MSDKIILLEDQKAAILEEWNSRPDNPPSLLDLINVTFPDKNVDGRSKEGKAVKAFLASQSIKARASQEYQAKEIELTPEHKEFIDNNYKLMTFVEIARVIFANEKITNLNKEAKVAEAYIKQIDPSHDSSEEINITHDEYKPPSTFSLALSKINKYIYKKWDKDKLVAKEKKNIDSLLGYMNTYRFIHQINSYNSIGARDLFESSFVRYTCDKNDLTQEEVDQYIVLSSEVVIASNIQQRVEHLQNLLDDAANDSDGRRIAMSLVEAINTAQNEYHQSVNRQQKLLESLKEKRSDRLKNQLKENASILNLVEIWKSEESRHKMIRLANLRREAVEEEIEKLTTMEELKARIMGISEGEILN